MQKKAGKKVIKRNKIQYVKTKTTRLNYRETRFPNQVFYSIRYKATGDKIDRSVIKRFAQKQSNELYEDSPGSMHFSVSMKFKNGIWRSGKITTPGEDISLWDCTDSGGFDMGDIVEFDLICSVPK